MYISAYMFLFDFIDKKVLKMGIQADGEPFLLGPLIGVKDRSSTHYSNAHFVKKCLSQCLSEVLLFK